MNGTPRAWNRFLLAVIGMLFMLAGAAVLALAAVPSLAQRWQDASARWIAWLSRLMQDTRMGAGIGSWVWLLVAAAMLVVVIVMLSWAGNQGKGRAGTLVDRPGSDADGAPGTVRVSCAVAEQLVKDALLERTDILGVSTTSYDFRGQTCLKVRILPRQGVAPQDLASEATALVRALDALLGVEIPVLISIDAAARTRFTKAERVR